MDINQILKELDNLFNTESMENVIGFLNNKCEEAYKSGNNEVVLTLLNEKLGYYRVTTEFEKGLETIEEIEALVEEMKLYGTLAYGTTSLNIATIYRAMGDYNRAKEYYKKTEAIFKTELDDNDYKMASLYNNMSLCYQENNEYDMAKKCLFEALAIIEGIDGAEIQVAITHTNLGTMHISCKEYELAKDELEKAYTIFEETDMKDEHFSACTNALGQLYFEIEKYDKAVHYYEKALYGVYSCYGVTKDYEQIHKSLMLAYERSGVKSYKSMLDVCEAFYEKYGKAMINEKFAEYKNEFAIGLCGEGSECFGVEDSISLDHDCGPGFAIWVSDEIYEKIGDLINEEYNKLPKVFYGYIRNNTSYSSDRCGACRIDDFYKRVLGVDKIEWDNLRPTDFDETVLATATNGKVFVDNKGEFTSKRNILLKYYDNAEWIEKLARELIYSAQTGQYNYGRAMARGEYVTANITLAEYMKSIMHVVFLMNKTYMPYYKWQHKVLKSLSILPEISYILEAIADMGSQRDAWNGYKYDGNPNQNDMIAGTIEIIAKLVVEKLQEMGLSNSSEAYLEVQGREVLKHMNDEIDFIEINGEDLVDNTSREELIESIVKYEWMEFDQVQNEGGRASCQDNWETFSIMRKSQYMTWSKDMLNELLWYIDDEYKKGRNLITEKYGRMMESTAPLKYMEIKDSFLELSDSRKEMMEAVIKIQVGFMEEFAMEYPKVAGTARSIHTYEDGEYNTSYETYLRGELSTYSDELMNMYAKFIVDKVNANVNLAYETMENTVKLYGYKSLEDAERRL